MDKQKAVEYLVGNEELLAHLYKLYAQKYSSYADFWGRLSDDEKTHAKKLRELSGQENVTFLDRKFNQKEIEAFKNSLEIAVEKFEDSDLTIQDALRTALKLEKDLVESKFFISLESDDKNTKWYLEEMTESVDKHRERIEKMMEKVDK